MLERRSSEDADGDRRMMGSGLRPLDLLGRSAGAAVAAVGVGPVGRGAVRRRIASACLRMWEKSYNTVSSPQAIDLFV